MSVMSSPPISPTSSLSPIPPLGRNPLLQLNVREILEKETVPQAKEVSRKVHVEIEKKKEELRMLVGERYRDLIDAADTIGTMSTSSASVFDQLTALREKFASAPTQLVNGSSRGANRMEEEDNSKIRVEKEELEGAAELKLSLEVPRQINVSLEKKMMVQALHFYVFYDKYLSSSRQVVGGRWRFVTADPAMIKENMKNSILSVCDEVFRDDEEVIERLADCMIVRQIVKKISCEEVVKEFLELRVQRLRQLIQEKNSDFVACIVSTLKSIHTIFIEPQLYNGAAKRVRKPKLPNSSFGFRFTTASLDSFRKETLTIEGSPRVTVLAELVLTHFVGSLKSVLSDCYEQQQLLSDEEFSSLQELSQYREFVSSALKSKETLDLMRIVLGTTRTLWTMTFHPIFILKCKKVAENWINGIFRFLQNDAFPRLQKLDEQLDLVSFVWKTTAPIDSKAHYDGELDLKLKLNSLSLHISSLCTELEDQFLELVKDFQHLGDSLVKDHISLKTEEAICAFLQDKLSSERNLFVGKLSTALTELCPTMWKLLNQNDKLQMRHFLQSTCEACWMAWSNETLLHFRATLEQKMSDLTPSTVASFMPVAEDFSSKSEGGDEAVKASIQIPVQLSHALHSLLFGICVELAKVGPQSIPKSVREAFRLNLGKEILVVYQKLTANALALNEGQGVEEQGVLPQVASQFMFDLKISQWFHPSLAENQEAKLLISTLQNVIDPFDLDIVIPKMKANIKRFLFEAHLTLGLLFSEETQSFIAQNFKTKQGLSKNNHDSSPRLSSALPLLPI